MPKLGIVRMTTIREVLVSIPDDLDTVQDGKYLYVRVAPNHFLSLEVALERGLISLLPEAESRTIEK